MTVASEALSGTFWETMLGLGARGIAHTLDTCASSDLHWSLDQARCLAHNTSRDTSAFKAIGEFAAQKLGAIPEHDTDTRLAALELVSGCLPKSDARSIDASKQFRAELERVFKTNPKAALEKAVLGSSSLLASDGLRETAANFIVRHTDPAKPTYLRHLAACASEETLEKIFVQIDVLGQADPLKAVAAIDVLLEYGRNLSGAQSFRASQKRERLETAGGFMARDGMLIVVPQTVDEQIGRMAEKPRARVLN